MANEFSHPLSQSIADEYYALVNSTQSVNPIPSALGSGIQRMRSALFASLSGLPTDYPP